jgi:hypothetical protein
MKSQEFATLFIAFIHGKATKKAPLGRFFVEAYRFTF